MASDGAKWSKDEINALIDAYSDAKMSADPMTTNRELYSSIKSLLEQNNNVQRSTKQIETKVKKLKSGYSKLKDRMKVSGAERPFDSKSLTSVEKGAFQHWDNLDGILGTHPVEDPPEEHLLESSAIRESDETESSAVNEVESGAAEANTELSAAEVNTTQRSKSPKRKSAKTGKPKKKPRLCDVVEQSNEQMKELKDYMQSNSVTLEARSKEREEDRVFFRQMMGMMSQTMMGMAQMLVQGGGPGYPPTQAYSPQSVQPNYTFTPTMGYGFHAPPATPSSASSVTSEPMPSEENDYYSF